MSDPVSNRSTPPDGGDPYRELFERSADAILFIEGDTFIDCNEAAVEMLRYSTKAEVLRTHPSVLSPPKQPDGRDSFEKANEMIALAFERGSHRFEWNHKRADGAVFPVEVLLTAVHEPDRQVLHVVWRDISERKALEEQLRHVQKMEAIGQLAGGIAHDFNNLLVVIHGHAELLGSLLEDGHQGRDHVRQIEGAADRAAALVRQLLAFGRRQQILPRVLDLNAVIRQTQNLLKPLVGDDIDIFVELCGEPVPIKSDTGQIEQILLNLTANAKDAMPEGGNVAIQTHTVQLTGGDGGITGPPLPPGEYVVLEISDTGVGMSPEAAAHAFDPFYTTKAVGKGTGLGLATVYGIARQNGGTADIFSSPGRGTTVRIHLPITDEPLSGIAAEQDATPDPGGGETVLVVEDEPGVSALVVNTLRKRGYKVLVAADGREASSLYRQNPGAIDLIVTDVIMPRMGGHQLIQELNEAGFAPRVLFMSGFTNDALTQLNRLDGDVDLLEKPFRPVELARRVRLALDR